MEKKTTVKRIQFVSECPHCRKGIEFLLRNVFWNAGDIHGTAHYKCQNCGRDISDQQKEKMLREGHWKKAEADIDFGSALNPVLLQEVSFGKVAEAIIQSAESAKEAMVFENCWLI